MPGLTDAHWHMTVAANTMENLEQADPGLMYPNLPRHPRPAAQRLVLGDRAAPLGRAVLRRRLVGIVGNAERHFTRFSGGLPTLACHGRSRCACSSGERAICLRANPSGKHREELTMVDEKKHSETAMGEPVSAREKTAQDADEVAMGRPTAPKDIDARSDAQIAMGQPATSAQATAQEGTRSRSARLRRPTRWRSGRSRMSPWVGLQPTSNGRSRRSTRRRWGSRRTDPS